MKGPSFLRSRSAHVGRASSGMSDGFSVRTKSTAEIGRTKSWSSRSKGVRRAGSLTFKHTTSRLWHNIKKLHLPHNHHVEDKDRPAVRSLDQLYAQAAGLFPILREKVQKWAAECGGCFPVEMENGMQCLRWEETRGNQWLQSKIKWASLKSYQRAIEKLVRSYDGRVERLLDVCRQSIIFETANELAHCIEQIKDDPDVAICAVKNRLSPTYDAKDSVGYRDIHINLRIVTSNTEHLGLDMHIVEVLLLLRPLAEIKSSQGHQRYVAFRNARGL